MTEFIYSDQKDLRINQASSLYRDKIKRNLRLLTIFVLFTNSRTKN